jgi:hypothetical protein
MKIDEMLKRKDLPFETPFKGGDVCWTICGGSRVKVVVEFDGLDIWGRHDCRRLGKSGCEETYAAAQIDMKIVVGSRYETILDKTQVIATLEEILWNYSDDLPNPYAPYGMFRHESRKSRFARYPADSGYSVGIRSSFWPVGLRVIKRRMSAVMRRKPEELELSGDLNVIEANPRIVRLNQLKPEDFVHPKKLGKC